MKSLSDIKRDINTNTVMRFIAKPYIDAKRKYEESKYLNSEWPQKLKKFKNMYEGKRCFVIGNGPSLTIPDLERIIDEYTFASNAIFSLFDKTEWRPTFYTCFDRYVINNIGNNLNNIEAKYCFFNTFAEKYINNKELDYYIIYESVPFVVKKYKTVHPYVSEDITRKVIDSHTVSFINIQIAIYMGFKEIYLLGIDNNYSKKITGNGKEINDKKIQDYAEGIKSIGVTGIQYIDTMQEGYIVAKEYCDTHGIKIMNATRGGKLEVYDRVEFESLVK